MSKSLFLQNVIAVIWDFDKTLSPQYMQTPLFERYGVDEEQFWREVNALPGYYKRAGITVQRDTCYLGHLLTYVNRGVMKGLSNAILREVGASVTFYDGIPDIFSRLKTILGQAKYQDSDLRLEHYVVSTGLAEMIRGSTVAPYLSGVWASEFIETPAPPGVSPDATPERGEITQIAGLLDNTTKTRAIFEINKGVNKRPDISVNDMLPEEERRVPIRNMIYVADGPSDIPSYSVIRKHGGLAYAVYETASPKHFAQVDELLRTGRVDACGPANYCAGGQTSLWLERQVARIADRMMNERLRALESQVGRGPGHVV
ncbi:MAG TPA: haloacid dehalogenase-like hydrolase [Candidatus Hydrogenedentes bacterium]|nr:haloacid dehalogenase-like hydrolase [Candidatus Hydrogenedentota bacterium]